MILNPYCNNCNWSFIKISITGQKGVTDDSFSYLYAWLLSTFNEQKPVWNVEITAWLQSSILVLTGGCSKSESCSSSATTMCQHGSGCSSFSGPWTWIEAQPWTSSLVQVQPLCSLHRPPGGALLPERRRPLRHLLCCVWAAGAAALLVGGRSSLPRPLGFTRRPRPQ